MASRRNQSAPSTHPTLSSAGAPDHGEPKSSLDTSIVTLLHEQRQHARKLLNDHRERIRSVEERLIESIQATLAELERQQEVGRRVAADQARIQAEIEHRHQEMFRQSDELSTREAGLEQRRLELDQTTDELLGQLNSQLEEVSNRRTLLDESETKLRRREEELQAREAIQSRGDAKAPIDQDAPADDKPSSELPPLRREWAPISSPPQLPMVGLNWEDLKRQMMAELEGEGERVTPGRAAERTSIQDLIRQTDAIVADKDRQIQELETLLANQSKSLGEVAVGASVFAEMLDQDTVIQEQREELNRLQAEWYDKLRKAELEISIERAKIARERAALEEKVRELETDRDRRTTEPSGSKDSNKEKRGRWLSKLGLNEIEKK